MKVIKQGRIEISPRVFSIIGWEFDEPGTPKERAIVALSCLVEEFDMPSYDAEFQEHPTLEIERETQDVIAMARWRGEAQ